MQPADRLAELQGQLDAVLEERITELVAAIRACQEVTAQIATTTLEIRRQEALGDELSKQLEPLSAEASRLETENESSAQELAALKADVERMQAEREALLTRLGDLGHVMKA